MTKMRLKASKKPVGEFYLKVGEEYLSVGFVPLCGPRPNKKKKALKRSKSHKRGGL
jgi:hypothetical protein